jgi:RNase P subunit RPR2
MQLTHRVICANGAIGNTAHHNQNSIHAVGGRMSNIEKATNGRKEFRRQAYEILQGRIVIICKKCNEKYSFEQSGSPGKKNPNIVVKRLKHIGWELRLDKTKATCPKCVEKRRMPVVKKAEELKRPEGRVIAEIHASLYEYFDSDKGEFLKGQSDQTIGKNLDVGWKYVKDIREEVYGKLKKDPEVQLVEMDIKKIDDRLAKLEENFRSSADELLEEIARVSSRVSKLQEKKDD